MGGQGALPALWLGVFHPMRHHTWDLFGPLEVALQRASPGSLWASLGCCSQEHRALQQGSVLAAAGSVGPPDHPPLIPISSFQ